MGEGGRTGGTSVLASGGEVCEALSAEDWCYLPLGWISQANRFIILYELALPQHDTIG